MVQFLPHRPLVSLSLPWMLARFLIRVHLSENDFSENLRCDNVMTRAKNSTRIYTWPESERVGPCGNITLYTFCSSLNHLYVTEEVAHQQRTWSTHQPSTARTLYSATHQRCVVTRIMIIIMVMANELVYYCVFKRMNEWATAVAAKPRKEHQ